MVRKKLKVSLVIFLAMCMIVSFIGCTPSDPANGNESSDVQSSESEESSKPTLENPNIKMILWNEPDEPTLEQFKEFEDTYGGKVNYEVTTWAQLEPKVLSAMSSGDGPDLVYTSQGTFVKYASRNIIMPLEGYIDLNDPLWNKEISDIYKWNGKNYLAITRGNADFIYFNKTLFENSGVKTPLEYYEDGEWNFENFRKVAIELTDDTNSDGSTDQWGYASWKYGLFVQANDGEFVELREEGDINLVMNNPESVNALQFMQDGYFKDKYIMPDGNVQWNRQFQTGKIAMIAEANYVAQHHLQEMSYEWDIAPFPTGPDNQSGAYPGSAGTWALANGAKNPEGGAAFRYIQARVGEEKRAENLSKYYTQEQIDLMDIMDSNVNISIHEGVGNWWDVQWDFWNEIFAGEAVTSTIDKYKPVFQREIDLVFEE